MKNKIKKIEQLTIDDIQSSPVWEYLNEDDSEYGDTAVRAVSVLPVKNLTGKVVGTKVRLANGNDIWATICNVSAKNPTSTLHFLTLTILRDGQQFTLSRYHDFDFSRRGPDALSVFLGLRVDQVFPISYDIRKVCRGNPPFLAGVIEAIPKVQLTQDEIMQMAVQGDN